MERRIVLLAQMVEQVGAANGDAEWAGLSGLAAYNFSPRLKGTVRADIVRNDKNGGGIFGSVPACADDECNSLIADGRNGFGPKMVFDDEVLSIMKTGYEFLHSIKVLPKPDMPKDAYNDGPLKQALKEMGIKAPVGSIMGQPRKVVK